jgi:hypothetical protein
VRRTGAESERNRQPTASRAERRAPGASVYIGSTRTTARREAAMTRRIALVVLLVGIAARAFANEAPDFPRVRPANAAARQLFDRAMEQSATVRRLAAELERSDLIVQIVVGPPSLTHVFSGAAHHASLRFLCASRGYRYVAIWLEAGGIRGGAARQVAILGHELAHAVEVARAPEVTDQASMRGQFERLGREVSWQRFETDGAQAVERLVEREVEGLAAARAAQNSLAPGGEAGQD